MGLTEDRSKICAFIHYYGYGELCDTTDLCEDCSILVAGVPLKEVHEWHKIRKKIVQNWHWCDKLERGEPMILSALAGRDDLTCGYCNQPVDIDPFVKSLFAAKEEFIRKHSKNVPPVAQL
jgi:hypothetical protein